MSVRVMSWVWEHSRSNPTQRLVLLAIADCCNDLGAEAYPSMATLMDKTSLSERGVRNAIVGLESLGELVVHYKAGPHGCNRYRVVMDNPARGAGSGHSESPVDPAPDAGNPARGAGKSGTRHVVHGARHAEDPARGAGDPARRAENPAPRAPKPSEPSRTIKNRPTRELATVDDSPTAQTFIGEWIDHCPKKPPGSVVAQVGKHLRAMLAEGIDPADVRAGLVAWHAKGLHPSTLPSVVNEIMNAGTGRARASPNGHRSTTDDRVQGSIDLGKRLQQEEMKLNGP